MSAETTLLEARNVARRHPDGRRWLLEHVSLEVRPGTRLSVTGPSGSGKTLLLRALAVLDPLDDGQIRWQGRPLHRDQIPGFRKAVIYLHQRPALWQETVEAALRGPLALGCHRGQAFDRDRIVGLLAQLGRDGAFLAQRAADLSGGEIQIASLLRAVQLDPTVLLLDEPTAALDPRTTAAVEAMLQRWVVDPSGGRAIVWVTHDGGQARRVGQRILHLRAGRIEDADYPT